MSGLRVIGTDTPQIQGSANTRQVHQVDTSGAAAAWDRAATTRAEANAELIRSQQARMALKQAELQQAQIDSQNRTSPIADIFNGAATVLGTIQEVRTMRAEQEAKMAEAEAVRMADEEERRRADEAAAFVESSSVASTELMAQLQGDLMAADQGIQRDIDSRGYIASYSDAVTYIHTRRDELSTDDYAKLIEWAGDRYEGRNQSQQDHLYAETRVAHQQAAEQVIARQDPALVQLGARIANSMTPGEAQRYIANADAMLQDMQVALLNEGTPPTVVLDLVNTRWNNIIQHASGNAEALAQLEQVQRRYQLYGEQIAQVEDAFVTGAIDTVTRGRMLAPLQLGLTGELDFGLLSGPEAMEEEVRRLELIEEMVDLNTPESTEVAGVLQGQILLQMNHNGGVAPPQFGAAERERLESTYTQARQYHDTVNDTNLEAQTLGNDRLTLQAESQQIILDIGYVENAITAMGTGDVGPMAELGFSNMSEASDARDELLAEYSEITAEVATIDQTLAQVRTEQSQAQDALSMMGLPHGLDYRAHNEYMESEEYQQLTQVAAEQVAESRQVGQDFSLGNSFTAAPVPLATIDGVQGQNQEDWSGILAPFPAGTTTIVTSGQGQRTGTYAGAHPGVDFGVPQGTPVLAPRSGRVTRNWYDYTASRGRGGGWVVSVEHADGTESSYLHLEGQSPLEVGTVVSQGQQLGTVGGTGGPDPTSQHYGPHLDLRVKSASGGSYDIDVSDWLAASVQESHPESGYTMPSLGMPPTSLPEWNSVASQYQAPPQGAFILENGDYLFNGGYYYNEQWYEDNPGSTGIGPTTIMTNEINQVFNNATPVEGTYASAEVGSYNTTNNDPTANYGYAFFDANPHAAAKVAEVANALRIPGQWLVDVMAYETGGTFNPGIFEHGGSGAVGLIQFYPGGGMAQVARDMGVSESVASHRLANMSFVEQMDWVQAYLSGYSAGDTQFVGRYDRIERLLSAVFQGQGTAMNNDIADLVDIGDGNITLGNYMKKLGNTVGRRYYTVQDQLEGTIIHDGSHIGCPACQAMLNSGTPVVPHVAPTGQGAVPAPGDYTATTVSNW